MTGFQKILQRMAENGDERADKLLVESLEYDDKTLPQFIAQYDSELSQVLDIPALTQMVNADPGSEDSKTMMEALKEFTELRNQGKAMHAPNASERLDVYGKKIPTVDDFMKAFGATMEDGEGEDDARAAFTNPENSRYWGNYSDADKNLAAYQMGYRDFRDMEGDLNRTAMGFQTRNQVEGYGPNNELQPVSWAVSALKGLATPRIKEAQAAGRDITWQDVTGDIAELGLNFVPGVGLVGKGGKVLARIGPKAELVGKGLGLGVESFSVPFATQAMDAGLLYNPNTLGTDDAGLNPRSDFSLPAMAAQAGGIAGAKGAIKGGAGMAKNAMETSMGEESGKKGFKQAFEYVERIGESTDDLIARRQAMLDRKAELAKQRANVESKNDTRVTSEAIRNGGYSDPNAIYDAENFDILTQEAKKFGKTQKLRKEYEDASAAYDAERMKRAQAGEGSADIPPEEVQAMDRWLKAGQAYDQAVAPERPFVQLPDGRFVYAQPGLVGGREHHGFNLADWRPGGDAEYFRIPPNDIKTMTEPGNKPDLLPKTYEMRGPTNKNIDNAGGSGWENENGRLVYKQSVSEASREPATLKAVQNDELLSRKLDPYNTAKETARDVVGNAAFNAMSREGLVGNIDALNEEREKALWNRQLSRLRPLVVEQGIGPEERRKRQDAVMNVMSFGLEGLPTEIYMSDPKLYRSIAAMLGVNGWQHYSERNAEPTTSYSSEY